MDDFDPLQMDERLGAAQRGAPNPVLLSRQIAAADAAYTSWRERLRDDAECEQDPLAAHRAVAGRTTFRDLEQLGEQDHLRVYLKRWVFCLAERRVNASLLQRVHHERYLLRVAVAGEPAPLSLSEALRYALRRPAAAPRWLEHYLRHSHSFASGVATLLERQGELSRRWSIEGYDPCVAAEPGVRGERSLVDGARDWLDRTQDMAFEHRRAKLADWLELALAREVELDWPARLGWRTFGEWFAGGDLLASLRLGSKRLPERVAPASFLRGLERLGQEWSEALAPTDQFFVVAHDPFRLRTRGHGALFAGLLLNPAFLKRCLLAESSKVHAALRPLHRAVLLESRARAFKVLAADAGRQGRGALRETFMAETMHRFGFQLPEAAVGALFTPDSDSGPAFAALMLAAVQTEACVTSHDQDWFRNPRAIDQLRSEAAVPPALSVDADSFARGSDLLYAKLAAALG